MYYLAVNTIRETAEGSQIAAAVPQHITWIKQQLAAGTVVQAGKWGDAGGVVVVRAEDQEEARSILQQDPLVSANLCDVSVERFFPDVATPRYD